MARALILALCLGSAYGLGGTTLRECPADGIMGYDLFNYDADCNELGEACTTFDDKGPGLCIQIIWVNDTVDPPVSTSA